MTTLRLSAHARTGPSSTNVELVLEGDDAVDLLRVLVGMAHPDVEVEVEPDPEPEELVDEPIVEVDEDVMAAVLTAGGLGGVITEGAAPRATELGIRVVEDQADEVEGIPDGVSVYDLPNDEVEDDVVIDAFDRIRPGLEQAAPDPIDLLPETVMRACHRLTSVERLDPGRALARELGVPGNRVGPFVRMARARGWLPHRIKAGA